MPPQLPERLDRVDQAVAGHVEVLTIHEPEVALGEHRHVADAHEGLAAADVEVVGSGTDLGQAHLGAGVPGACAVANAGNPLLPVVLVEDQAATGGVGHHRTVDPVQAGVANQLAPIALHQVDTPAVRAVITPHAVEPLVLILEHGRRRAAEVLGNLEALHAAVLNEPGHVLSRQRSKLDGELANLKAHDRSEHRFSFLLGHAKVNFTSASV